GDLQSLSWLTAVDVPRLQQMASGRVDLGGPCVPHPHPGALAGVADLHVGATPSPLLHGPAGMAPRDMPGLGPITGHRDSQMSQFPVGGQPSSGLQDPPHLYSPATQPQFPLPLGAQQLSDRHGPEEQQDRQPACERDLQLHEGALPLLQDGPRWVEELGAAQPVSEQVLREGGEQDERLLPQGLPVGSEPGPHRQDGGGDAQVEEEGPGRHPPEHGQP
ncbi:FOXN4 isoform 3, partial [Pongo abelii]